MRSNFDGGAAYKRMQLADAPLLNTLDSVQADQLPQLMRDPFRRLD
jgi:hypothetical protein